MQEPFLEVDQRMTNLSAHRLIAALFMMAVICLALVVDSARAMELPNLRVTTSSPNINTFVKGEAADLTVKIGAGASSGSPVVSYIVNDIWGQVVAKGVISVNKIKGVWSGSARIPTSLFGYYKVSVKAVLAGSTLTIQSSGSRPAGFITYSVVPSPRSREDVSEGEAFFGMQGGFSKQTTALLPLLGVHWVLGNLDWGKLAASTNHADIAVPRGLQNGGDKGVQRRRIEPLTAQYGGINWPLYPVPTLEVTPPKWLSSLSWPERYKLWSAYCRNAALLFMHSFPDQRQRIYQVTWEPNFPWQFDGSPEQLVKWTKSAFAAVHSVDKDAVVIGPTNSRLNQSAINWSCNMIQLGLSNYVDGWSFHPYTTRSLSASARLAQLISGINHINRCLESHSSRMIPLYSTEAGDQSQNNGKGLIAQALYIVDSNVIMKAMGLRMSIAFYIADFPNPPNYGFYYNDISGLPFGADQLSPKPVAPAYAVMTYMLGATVPDGSVSGLQKSFYAFRFKGKSRQVIVAWSRDGAGHELSIPPGNYHIYGWMGNPVKSNATQIKVGQFPVYIVYQ
ncbi:hypothetical protein [Metallibacterium scheffleri]